MATDEANAHSLSPSLHQLPQGWRYQALSSLVDKARGISYGIVQPGAVVLSGVPIVRVNNVREGRITTADVLRVDADVEALYQRTRLRGGEVLLTLVGTLGETATVPLELNGWNVARAVAVVPVRPEIGADWVRYCLGSAQSQHLMRTWATTTVQATLNLRDVANLPIPIPPHGQRNAIVRILGALDDKIELNRRMNETLEAMARALFQSWFVDFDPVHAKAEGRQPVGMDSAMAESLPDRFEGLELEALPAGWRLTELGAIAGINERNVAANYSQPTIQYVDIASVQEGALLGTTRYSLADAPSRARRLVRDGDTIWSTVRPNRKSYLFIHDPAPNMVMSTGFAVLTPRDVPSSFLYAWTTTTNFVDYLVSNADGSAYPAVRAERFAQAPVLLPNEEVLAVFHALVGPMRERIARNYSESQTLAAIRDTLLPKLLSGAVRVRDAEKVVEEVLA